MDRPPRKAGPIRAGAERAPRAGGPCNPRQRAAQRPRSRPAGAASANGIYAALDLGSNNCRLLVAKPAPDGFRVIDAFSRIVRLGEGVAVTGRLSDAAIGRTIRALKVCAGKMRRDGVTRSRAVATEACRKASNCGVFLDQVRRETGIALEIITSQEEAHLGLHGCVPLLSDHAPQALMFDIGGGSTEVSWIEVGGAAEGGAQAAGGPRLRAWESLPIGVVGLTERYGGREVPRTVYDAMIGEVRQALAPFEARHRLGRRVADGRIQMLGTSGTVTTLTGVHKDLPRYDRGQVDGAHLDFDTLDAVIARIAAMSYAERAAHPCIGRERADLVISGCAILEAICRTWPVGRLRVADRGLREGILLNLMAGP
jgi:exopolyphosphatase/guanosine-5'-triphosphate,3'-diphosphate pyrophosphatase